MQGRQGPLFVALHWLSGSSSTWQEVSSGLVAQGARCAAIDLPGFGEAAGQNDFSVTTTVEQTIQTIAEMRGAQAAPWFLVGHSMGGKIAAIVARAAAAGDQRLAGLSGVVLVSPSPPGPEPMEEKQREKLLSKLGQSSQNADEDRSHAQDFVDDNVGKLPLLAKARDRAVRDILRMNRKALVAWLVTGSKEDWSSHVGLLDVPALILAGSEEPALGPDAQRQHTLPHFSNAHLVPLVGGGHLAPLERPGELVGRVIDFAAHLGHSFAPTSTSLGANFSAVLASDSTSPQTRAVLDARLHDELGARSEHVLNSEEQITLRALTERVVPHTRFNLAARLHESLSHGARKGWRHDLLPSDIDAWRKGLQSLDNASLKTFAVPFVALDAARQDDLLASAREGKLGKGLLGTMHIGSTSESYDAQQMQAWFEDVRGELTRLYIADPRTMEQIGFTGFADEHGFTHITLNSNQEKYS